MKRLFQFAVSALVGSPLRTVCWRISRRPTAMRRDALGIIPCVTFPTLRASSNAKDVLRVYRPTVTYFRKFGALVLLLASLLTPAMACAVASSPMTSAESACCQVMRSKCGQKGMPASHGCCHKIPGSVYDNALNAEATTLHPVAVHVVWLPALQVWNPTSSLSGWIERLDYSPLKPLPSTISILRI
jgi:hypothetical protein